MNHEGFSLLELAIVLFVIGIILGGLLVPLANKIEFENRIETQVAMENIESILLGFVIKNGYFPCPDTDGDGDEDLVIKGAGPQARTCDNEEGDIPFFTLGIGHTDAWNNEYTYRVDPEFADRNGSVTVTDGVSGDACTATAGVSFALCSDGNITVLNASKGNRIADNIPAIIISHGKNFNATPHKDESENSDNDTIFVNRGYSQDSTRAFDDIVIWVSPHILRNRMVEAGVLP